MRQTSVAQLFEFHKESLNLTWISGGDDRLISVDHDEVSPTELVGLLNLIHPTRIQVLGTAEIAWARKQPAEKVRHHMAEIVAARPPAIIVAEGNEVPDALRDVCHETNIPLISTPTPTVSVIDQLRNYFSRELADRVSLHGVFMDVLGMGVLITGESGVGKSELALELISRGHGLVADDIVEVSRVAPDLLEGRCPEMLKDFLEVRGLGVLNIRTVFGETACRRKMKLRLVVHLEKPTRGIPEATRLPLDAETHEILGISIRRVVIPVAAGRNLAVLLETAVRSTILLLRGIDTTMEFIDRQKRALDQESDG
jgi:HPr kinase/phosphorylase